MVDIFDELGDRKSRKPKLFRAAPVAGIVGTVVAGLVLFLLLGRAHPPIGRELSDVSGVGIVRRSRLQGTQASNVQIEQSGPGKIYRDGFELIYALADATDQRLPIIQNKPLPAGRYRVSAMTDTGGAKKLLKMLSVAYSDAFGLNISEKEIETEAYVMTCPNRSRLGFRNSANMAANFDGDFRGGDSGDNANTRFDAIFNAQMSELADYVAYMMRKAWEARDSDRRDDLLAVAVVDETGLGGYYTGSLSWRFYVPLDLIEQLQAKGIQVTRAKRKVRAIVIE